MNNNLFFLFFILVGTTHSSAREL